MVEVLDDRYSPLACTFVRVVAGHENWGKQTDIRGKVSFDKIPTGNAEVRFDKTHYLPSSIKVDIKENELPQITHKLASGELVLQVDKVDVLAKSTGESVLLSITSNAKWQISTADNASWIKVSMSKLFRFAIFRGRAYPFTKPRKYAL